MPILKTALSAHHDAFKHNEAAMKGVLDTLFSLIETYQAGGGKEAAIRHREKNKLLPRERIAHLLDPGSPFFFFF